jgi:DNA-binding CsgD family transcriptional regulator
MELELLSKVIGDIYDATLEAELWPQALDGILKFVGGRAANFFWHDLSAERAGVFHCVGIDPVFLRSYFETYIKFNPFYPAASYFAPGVIFGSPEILPMPELTQTRFYLEWLRPQGLADSLSVNLEKSVHSVATLAIILGDQDGLADENARRRLRLIVPHMVRASSISLVVAEHLRGRATLSDAMDQMTAGVFLVDDSGRLVYANAAASNMLSSDNFLRIGPLGLIAVDPNANRTLQSALSSLGRAGDKSAGASILLKAEGREHWLAHVLPLTPTNGGRSAVGHSATAAIFVRKTTIEAASALETVARLYGLTGSELRVLSAVVEIGGVPEIADTLGISESTVRTHLKQLFQKTGSHRQADLVKLVATHSKP